MFKLNKGSMRKLVFLFTFFPIIVLGLGGCAAYRHPPGLNKAERKLLVSPPLPYTVSIIPWSPDKARRMSKDQQVYGQSLAELMNDSKVFRVSRFEAKAGADSDLIATSTDAYCNTAVVPIFTIISFGLIPTIFDDEYCEGLILRRSRSASSSDSIEIDFSQKSRVVIGWAATVIGLLPGWSYFDPGDDARFRERFRLEVIRHQSDIKRLVGR